MEPGTLIKKALLHVPDMPTSRWESMHEKAGASWPGWVSYHLT